MLDLFNEQAPAPRREVLQWRGLSAEHVELSPQAAFAYEWSGTQHYVALHDITLAEGEATLDRLAPSRVLDLRDRLTFVPKGCGIAGWSHLTRRRNAFTALYYDSALLAEELDSQRGAAGLRPMLYFENAGLASTLSKLRALLQSPAPGDALYAETLGLLAALEIDRLQAGVQPHLVPASGGLTAGQERLVREFVAENLQTPLALPTLAGLAGLSRYHFLRAFRKTFGLPPHQFVVEQRVAQAKRLLQAEELSIGQVAETLGFGSIGQFSTTFRKVVGCTPSGFRRSCR